MFGIRIPLFLWSPLVTTIVTSWSQVHHSAWPHNRPRRTHDLGRWDGQILDHLICTAKSSIERTREDVGWPQAFSHRNSWQPPHNVPVMGVPCNNREFKIAPLPPPSSPKWWAAGPRATRLPVGEASLLPSEQLSKKINSMCSLFKWGLINAELAPKLSKNRTAIWPWGFSACWSISASSLCVSPPFWSKGDGVGDGEDPESL